MHNPKLPNIQMVLLPTVYDAVVMGKICHTIVDDVGDDNVFLKEIRKEKHRK